jgi:hypothetical protein
VIVADGAANRAVFGSLAWIFTGLMFCTMTVVALATNGIQTGLPLGVFLVVAVCGVFDAAAGFAATAGLGIGCILAGSAFSFEGFTALVLIGTLWFGLGIMVNNLRLFIRKPPRRVEEFAERCADLLIGSLFCGYLGYKFAGILSGPNDVLLPIQRSASAVGWTLGVAIAVRYIANSVTLHFFPERMRSVSTTEHNEHHAGAFACSIVLRTLAAGVIFATFLGMNATVVALLVLYAADLALPGHIPADPIPRRWSHVIPHNLGKVLALTVTASVASILLRNVINDPYRLVLDTLVIVMAVALTLNVASARWTPSHHQPTSWKRIGGVILVAVTILQLSDLLIR